MSKLLTPEQALEIYNKAHSGKYIQKEIAEEYGVGVGTVSSIKTGKTWSSITGHAEESFQDLPGEIWRVVDGYPEYDVSNLGRIRSRKWNKLKLLKQRQKTGGSNGRYYVDFGPRKEYVHIVVARAFHPRDSYTNMECHHKDFDRFNNEASNLEWLTTLEHAEKHRIGT